MCLLPFDMQLMARLEGGRPLGTILQTPLANLGGARRCLFNGAYNGSFFPSGPGGGVLTRLIGHGQAIP